ncbi:ATP-binding protein [Streptomyces sp. NPDC005574]|uniref:ATP-binding protein n=1 Tax=Streptomyces sp. NPDC005574 TaxID=3156891 RepID=UPI0033A30540
MPGTPAGPDRHDDEIRRGLRERTALLSSFAAQCLAPVEDAAQTHGDAAVQDFLLEDCSRTTTPRGRRWSLAPGPRARTLDGLGSRDRLLVAAESAPGGREDPACAWAVRLLRGTAPPLSGQSFDELYTTLSVVGWFQDARLARQRLSLDGVALPRREDIEYALGRARLLQPLHALTGTRFAGRARELAWLSDRLDDAPDGGRPSAAQRTPAVRVFVHGPGGVGKSTLLARFVLERTGDRAGRMGEAVGEGEASPAGVPFAGPRPATGRLPDGAFGTDDTAGGDVPRAGSPAPPGEARPPTPMPCLYLTFDRHDLVAERPLTLVAEAVRQLTLLKPQFAHLARDLVGELANTLTSDRLTRSEEGHLGPRAAHRRDELTLIDAFAALVTSVTGGTARPWVLALDAFEQVQRSGPVAVERLLDFLTLMHQAHPGLRVLAAGRAPFGSATFRSLRLDGFDPDTARSFLYGELTDGAHGALPAARRRELDAITRIVGTGPLNLKLAAALVRREGTRVLDDPRLRSELLLELGSQNVQGFLYRRILDHLDDPDLRSLASPGLVVRTLTPGVIRDVLAEPCELGLVDADRARRLFDGLRAEVTLVEAVPGRDAVVHRGDVRRVMLALVRRDRPSVVNLIHRSAVRYYARLDAQGDDAVENRAEELYHRLALNQSTRTLDERWTDAAGPRLEGALDELPARAQVYLTEKLGNSATAGLRRKADGETWERQVLRLGRAHLAADQPAEVLNLLSERRHRVERNLELTLLSMRAGLALRRPAAAFAHVERAQELAAESGDPTAFVELALLGARACEDLGRFDVAMDLLVQARRVGGRPGMAVRLLSVSAAQLRIHRRRGTSDGVEARALRADTVLQVQGLHERSLRRHPVLIRELAAEIGDELPELVSYTAGSLGVGGAEGPDDALLGTFTGEVVHTPRPVPAAEPPGQSGARVAPVRDTGPSARPGSVSVSSVSRGMAVGSRLGVDDKATAEWNRALVHSYRHEVDRPHTGDAVVVIPGFAGSTLVDGESGATLWARGLDLYRARTFRGIERAMGRLSVTEEERLGTPRRLRPAGLLSLPVWLPLLGGLSPYGALVRGVGSVALHDDAVLPFPYDWRLSADSSARLLAHAALDHLSRWKRHPARHASAYQDPAEPPKLVLIAHSTGGLVVQSALAQFPELARATRDVVAVGTPFRGVPAAVTLFGPPRSERHTAVNAARAALRTMPGVYDLLPDAPCVLTDVGGLRRLTADDVAALGGDRALASAALDARRGRTAAGPQPRLHAVVGTSQPTAQSLSVVDGVAEVFRHVPRLHPDGAPVREGDGRTGTVNEGGDGLVPVWSATPPEYATCLDVVAQHGSLPSSATVINLVQRILTAGSDGTDPPPAEVGDDSPVRGRAPGRVPPDPDAGLAASFGISSPSQILPGVEWSLTITGAHHTAVTCRVLRAETGEVAARPTLRPVPGTPGTSTAGVVVDGPGLYTILAQAGGLSATALVVAAEEWLDT